MAKAPSLSSQIMGKTLGGSKEEKTRAFGEAQRTLRETAEQEQKLTILQEKIAKATGKESELLKKQIEKQIEIVKQFQKKGAIAKNYISVLQVPISTWRSDMLEKILKMEDRKSTIFFKALGKQWSGSQQMRGGFAKIFSPLSSLFSDFIPFFQDAKDMISGIKDVGVGAYKFFTGTAKKERKQDAVVDKLETTNDLAKQLKLNLVDMEVVQKQILDYAKKEFKASGKARLKFAQQATADLAAARAAQIENKIQTNIANDPDWVEKNQELYQKMLDELKNLKEAGKGGNATSGEKWIRKAEEWNVRQREILSEEIKTLSGTARKQPVTNKVKPLFYGLGGMFQQGEEDEDGDGDEIKDVRIAEKTSQEIQNVRLISPTLSEFGDEFYRALSKEGDRQESLRERINARTAVTKQKKSGMMDWIMSFIPKLTGAIGPLFTSAIATIGPLITSAIATIGPLLGPALAVAAAAYAGYKVGGIINKGINKVVKATTGKESVADWIYDKLNGDEEKKADAEREIKLKKNKEKIIQNLLNAPSPVPTFQAATEIGPAPIIPVPVSTTAPQSKGGYYQGSLPSGGGATRGWVSEKFEAGKLGAGAISKGKGDFGGASYGKYQLSSKAGTLQTYLNQSKYKEQFVGLIPGTKEFDEKWKTLAATDSKFGEEQHEFIGKTHYIPQLNKLKSAGLDLSQRGAGVQEMLWSTAVQYGTKLGTETIQNALKDKNISKMSDKDIIDAVQQYKLANVGVNFKSSSKNVQQSVANRIINEQKILASLTRDEASGKTPDIGSAAQAIRASEKDVLLASAQQGIFAKTSPATSAVTSSTVPNGNLVMANRSSRGEGVPERWNLADASMMHLVYQNTI
jgi:hypothetical protein